MRVLLIDDDAENQFSGVRNYVEALQVDGCETIVYMSVKRAIEHVRDNTNPEDIVVLDMMMPVDLTIKNETISALSVGAWILKKLRVADSAYLNVPVVVLTNRDLRDVDPTIAGFGRTWAFHKSNVPAFHLPELLRQVLEKAKMMT